MSTNKKKWWRGLGEKWMPRLTIFLVMVAIGGCVAWMKNDVEQTNIKIRRNYELGNYIDIGNERFSVHKQILANDECYYIYRGDRKSFTIPCEEK